MSASSKGHDQHAWALLALKSAPTSPHRVPWIPDRKGTPIAKIQGKEFEYMVLQNRVIIGRNSSKGDVDVNIVKNCFISRRHVEIFFESPNFFLTCNGKNGVFINGVFQRKDSKSVLLPKQCTIRFPSTNIKIQFHSLVDENDPEPARVPSPPKKKMAPLKINIPEPETNTFSSPFPSPTGTISAANSCPTSPRHREPPTFQPVSVKQEQDEVMVKAVYAAQQHIDDKTDIGSTVTIAATEEVVSLSDNGTTGYHSNGMQTASVTEDSCFTSPSVPDAPNSPGVAKDDSKPPYSYAQLIVQAISSAPDKQLTLSGIYSFITKHYPYYRTADKGWQNSIRHNLSLNRYFVKVARNPDEPGKGSFWKIDGPSETKLIDQAFKRRRQRGTFVLKNQLNHPSSRSAPVSPSQIGMSGLVTPECLSREGSPVSEYMETSTGSPLGTSHYEISSVNSNSPPQNQSTATILSTVQNPQHIVSALQGKYYIASGASIKPAEIKQLVTTTNSNSTISVTMPSQQVIIHTADPSNLGQVILPSHVSKYGGGYVTVNGEIKRVTPAPTQSSNVTNSPVMLVSTPPCEIVEKIEPDGTVVISAPDPTPKRRKISPVED